MEVNLPAKQLSEDETKTTGVSRNVPLRITSPATESVRFPSRVTHPEALIDPKVLTSLMVMGRLSMEKFPSTVI